MYRITAVLKVETGIITSISESLIGRAHTIIDKKIHISVFYYKNGMIYSNLSFFFDLKSDIIGINELTMILKIICQCDVRHIIMLLIKTATSLLKVSANINTSITDFILQVFDLEEGGVFRI
jgi:hypothetical protein